MQECLYACIKINQKMQKLLLLLHTPTYVVYAMFTPALVKSFSIFSAAEVRSLISFRTLIRTLQDLGETPCLLDNQSSNNTTLQRVTVTFLLY